MRTRTAAALLACGTLVITGCDNRVAPPSRAVPANIAAVESPSASVTVGTVAGPATVRVTDAQGAPISGVAVMFVISAGAGRLSRTADTTNVDGIASTVFTAGTQRGPNQLSALVQGLQPLHFNVSGVEGPTRFIAIATRDLRLPPTLSTVTTSAVPRDTFFNATSDAAEWTARDTSLVEVTVSLNNLVRATVRRRPGQTWLVGTAGSAIDSILVTVQSSTEPCAFLAAPTSPGLGDRTDLSSGTACFHADADTGEFVLVGHYNTAVSNSSALISATAFGIESADTLFPPALLARDDIRDVRDAGFEAALRARESREVGQYVVGARAWYGSPRPALRAAVNEGDVLAVNINAQDFCAAPKLHSARVAAITQTAIVLADLGNPANGFTDDEYRAFGETMDTLVNPLDTAEFGAPTDIDNNGRTIIFFTRAVNDLTPAGSPNGIVLGFYYLRDLLPLRSPFGDCPGSNVAEMFYMLVPDPAGVINGNKRDKAFVQNVTAGTIAHEYQHLINASRRMYVNMAPRVDEEVWLNEGLSHIAEELLFYRASGLVPRSNIDATLLAAGTPVRAALNAYQLNNLRRYREYLKAPEDDSPVAANDDLGTRGATWSFLRYMADRARTADGDFWRRLVNSQRTGASNIDDALVGTGLNTLTLMRDWALSVVTDDIVPEPATLRQPSWNFPSAMPAADVLFALAPRILQDGLQLSVQIVAGGSTYMRFAVPPGRDALVHITGFNGRPLPPGMDLTVVRIK